jgi:hypothetical protein
MLARLRGDIFYRAVPGDYNDRDKSPTIFHAQRETFIESAIRVCSDENRSSRPNLANATLRASSPRCAAVARWCPARELRGRLGRLAQLSQYEHRSG